MKRCMTLRWGIVLAVTGAWLLLQGWPETADVLAAADPSEAYWRGYRNGHQTGLHEAADAALQHAAELAED